MGQNWRIISTLESYIISDELWLNFSSFISLSHTPEGNYMWWYNSYEMNNKTWFRE